MGADRVCPIAHADFVTPPEFAGLSLAENPTGRIGGVDLELIDEGHGPRLGRCWQQIPLRVMPPFRFDAEQPGLVYLINPTAGLFDGDGHLVRLTAKKGTRTVFVGQSATRIHPSLAASRSFSTQQWGDRRRRDGSVVAPSCSGRRSRRRDADRSSRISVELAGGATFAGGATSACREGMRAGPSRSGFGSKR